VAIKLIGTINYTCEKCKSELRFTNVEVGELEELEIICNGCKVPSYFVCITLARRPFNKKHGNYFTV
jgi:hypothetical protein